MRFMDPTRSELEDRFRVLQDSLPPHVRVARAAAMYAWARQLIGREIVARTGPLSAARLKWETALRLYGCDAESRKLIQRMLDHVSA
jgi:hypothetical protein